jgi:hypothetical protein
VYPAMSTEPGRAILRARQGRSDGDYLPEGDAFALFCFRCRTVDSLGLHLPEPNGTDIFPTVPGGCGKDTFVFRRKALSDQLKIYTAWHGFGIKYHPSRLLQY